MGSHATQVPSGSCAAATAYPERIMLLAPYGGGKDQACDTTGDAETIAAGRTSSGHHISVSLRREPSPALSRICLRFRHGVAEGAAAYSSVVAAAHGGSVLLRIVSKECYEKSPATGDYFVYNAGAAAAADPARPPSLFLLPPFTPAKRWECLDISATGLVCRGEAAEFVVAQLRMVWVMDAAAARPPNKAAELLLFRDGEWRVKRPRIVHDHGEDGDMFVALWEPQAVVPLGDDGDGLLCWVDFSRGVVFSDVLDRTPVLRYVPYPMEAMKHRRLVCTDGCGAVKLVTVSLSSRCCSDDEVATAVVVDTWTLQTDDMAWVLETDTTIVSTPPSSGRSQTHRGSRASTWWFTMLFLMRALQRLKNWMITGQKPQGELLARARRSQWATNKSHV